MNAYGGVEVLQVVTSVVKPVPQNEQVLVEVKSVGLNPFDGKLRQGYMKAMIPLTFPVTAGGDFSGVVSVVGTGVSDYKVGDEVFGTAMILSGGSGALADFATVTPGTIAKKPKNTDFNQAASLPLVGSSAVQALRDHMKLQIGQKILIHGGAGGIGSVAIQLAKAMGAFVATTVNNKGREFVGQLGADIAVDFKTEQFEKKLSGYDAVFDTVGGEVTDKSFLVLKKGGVLVSMAGKPNEELTRKYQVTSIGQGTKTNAEHLNAVRELVEKGMVKPQLAKVFPMSQVQDAYRFLESGHPQGKVVVTLN